MSITLYPVPNTEFYIDEMYNMCNCEGVLYAYNGLTITFNNYLQSLGQTLRKRSAYGDTPLPATIPRWSEIPNQTKLRNPADNLLYGVKDSFAYVHLGGDIAGNARGLGSGPMLYCRSDWAQRVKRSVIVPDFRSKFINPAEINIRTPIPKPFPTIEPPPFMFRP